MSMNSTAADLLRVVDFVDVAGFCLTKQATVTADVRQRGDVLRLQKAGGHVGWLGRVFVLGGKLLLHLRRIRKRCNDWDCLCRI